MINAAVSMVTCSTLPNANISALLRFASCCGSRLAAIPTSCRLVWTTRAAATQMATIKTQMESKGGEENPEALSSVLSPASNALSLEEAQAKFGTQGAGRMVRCSTVARPCGPAAPNDGH